MKRLGHWLVPFPFDWRFFRLPAVVFVAVWIVYFLVESALGVAGRFDWAMAAYWAQVAAALSILGGAVLAVGEVAQALREPAAELELGVNFVQMPVDGDDVRLFVQVANIGSAPAHGVRVSVLYARDPAAPPASFGVFEPTEWTVRRHVVGQLIRTDSPDVSDELAVGYVGSLPAGSGQIGVLMVNQPGRTDGIWISAWATNAMTRRWQNPDMPPGPPDPILDQIIEQLNAAERARKPGRRR